jgi:signal transduction histidine kinase
MRFPPPVRYTAPLLALVFGLLVTWFDYRLNLDLDLARHLAEIRMRTDSNGRRLAVLSERLLAAEQRDALQTQVETMPDVPEIEIVGVMDHERKIIADSSGKWRGRSVESTPLAAAAALIDPTEQVGIQRGENRKALFCAYPFRIGQTKTGWALLVFSRADAIAAAQADANSQLRWMASAMALFSFALWSALHYGFAARLARLAVTMRAFGEGKNETPSLPKGGDEVGELAGAFSTMAAKLRIREAEQVRLEREVLEISESERRRIGHDLHDGLGQQLTAASMTTNALVGALNTDAPALVSRGEDIGRQIREAIAEARALSRGLAPVALVDDGLMAALTALVESGSRGNVRCIFECAEPVRLRDAEVAGHIYRIAQEALNNALKHASPSEIRIGLESRDGVLVLEVDDDGDGLHEKAEAGDGIGLRVMCYRAHLIGGTLEIGPAPAGGTRVKCRVKLTT